MYEHEHNCKMSTSAIASMLSTMLYYKRFFPYYAYNIIGGLDENGKDLIIISFCILHLYSLIGKPLDKLYKGNRFFPC